MAVASVASDNLPCVSLKINTVERTGERSDRYQVDRLPDRRLSNTAVNHIPIHMMGCDDHCVTLCHTPVSMVAGTVEDSHEVLIRPLWRNPGLALEKEIVRGSVKIPTVTGMVIPCLSTHTHRHTATVPSSSMLLLNAIY